MSGRQGADAAVARVRTALEPAATDRGGASGVLLVNEDGAAACRLLDRIEEGERRRGTLVLAGHFREGLARPLGGLLMVIDELVRRTAGQQPEIVQRSARLLVTLLPALRRHPALERAVPLRPMLADWALGRRGAGLQKFFSRYDLGPWTVAALVHVALDTAAALAAAQGAPVLLCLEDLELADLQTLRVLGLLGLYAAPRPLAVCASVRSPAPDAGSQALWAELEGWHRIELAADGPATAAELRQRLTGEQLAASEAAAALAAPFEPASWGRLLPAGTPLEDLTGELVGLGILRRTAGGRLAFARAGICAALYAGLRDRREAMHAAALASSEAEDPFTAAWHARGAGRPDALRRHAREAMLCAWAAAAFDTALALAGEALDGGEAGVRDALLAGLLCYEAGRHGDADRWLAAAAESPPAGIPRTTVRRLLGHNAVFGMGAMARGRSILTSVRAELEARGEERAAGYVRNSIAFTLFQERDVEAAIALEESSLAEAGAADARDDLLLGFLQLNLGRLYRSLGRSDQAVRWLAEVPRLPGAELNPSLLLIVHGTLAHLHSLRGERAAELAALHHCLQLVQGAEIEAIDERAVQTIERAVGELPAGRATTGDRLLFALHLGLAVCCRRLGLRQAAEGYLAGARSVGRVLGERGRRAAEAALAAADGPPAAGGSGKVSRLAAGPALERHARHLRDLAGEQGALAAAIEALVGGKALAVLQPLSLGAEVRLLESLVLFDPRTPALAERVCSELAGFEEAEVPGARAAVALSEALAPFAAGLRYAPLAWQQACVRPAARSGLAGLTPLRLRLRVLSPALDGPLFALLQGFAQRTGAGVLAAVPFRLWNRDLVADPEQAGSCFLISSLDALLLDRSLLGKAAGAHQALLPLRPRLSRRATVLPAGDGTGALVRLRSQRQPPGRVLKLHPEVLPLLKLIDGRRTVAEILGRIGGGREQGPGLERRLCGFLQRLWSQGVLCFDDAVRLPAAEARPC